MISFLSSPSLLLSYPWCLPSPPFSSFPLLLLLFLLSPICHLGLLFLELLLLLSSPRIFGPLLSSLLVLALLQLLIFASAGSTTFSFGPCLATSITSCSLYDDPLLFPVTDDGSDSEGVCSLP